MLTIILAESSLELIPESMYNHPSVISYSKKFRKDPSNTLLDNSWHFAAMKGIENEIKRGRPDLIHLTLLSICTTPAFYERKFEVYVHTINNKVITINNNIRLPKSYHRFQGLIEQLFVQKSIRSSSDDQTLMEIEDSSMSQLISDLNPSQIIGLTTKGHGVTTFDRLAKQITDGMCVIIGGFQKGHFGVETDKIIGEQSFSIGTESLEAHVVANRLVYEYEKTIFI